MVDALGVCLPDDPEGNAKLMFSILDCLPRYNRVSFAPQTPIRFIISRFAGNFDIPDGSPGIGRFQFRQE